MHVFAADRRSKINMEQNAIMLLLNVMFVLHRDILFSFSLLERISDQPRHGDGVIEAFAKLFKTDNLSASSVFSMHCDEATNLRRWGGV